MTAPGRCVLILGGTGEGRRLAGVLVARGVAVTSSLAGRVADPLLPEGDVRIGGFGGADGLASWLLGHRVAAVIDATHPFAQRISGSARVACRQTGVPLLRLERPPWVQEPGDRWHRVPDLAAAADAVGALGRRVLLTLGRTGPAAFARVDSAWFLVRSVQPPPPPLPPRRALILDRGPFTLAGEEALLDAHRIDLVVTRDSGGTLTAAKLQAARRRGIPVVVVQRPVSGGAERVETVEEAAAWVQLGLRCDSCRPGRAKLSAGAPRPPRPGPRPG